MVCPDGACPEKSGEARICVNLQKLNKAVERGVHPANIRGGDSQPEWFHSLLITGHGVLADSTGQRQPEVGHLHHTVWKILL